jgi:hypothetical protein
MQCWQLILGGLAATGHKHPFPPLLLPSFDVQ